eukprot:750159-Hanusia_phi.AAC.1
MYISFTSPHLLRSAIIVGTVRIGEASHSFGSCRLEHAAAALNGAGDGVVRPRRRIGWGGRMIGQWVSSPYGTIPKATCNARPERHNSTIIEALPLGLSLSRSSGPNFLSLLRQFEWHLGPESPALDRIGPSDPGFDLEMIMPESRCTTH